MYLCCYRGVRIELALLEISGSFKLDNKSQITKDHFKVGYELVVAMLLHAYNFVSFDILAVGPFRKCHASFDIFSSLCTFSVHAKKAKYDSGALKCLGLVNISCT